MSIISKATGFPTGYRRGCQAWSTAVGLGPIPQWFAGSNPAPCTLKLIKAG